MMNKKQLSSKQQRIGKLIEEYICKRMELRSNNRQHKIGFYDAYDMNTIYEIKAIDFRNNRATIDMKNHKQLLSSNGDYIFVRYELVSKDKELKMITDISILDIIKMDCDVVNDLMVVSGSFYIRNYRGKEKEFVRISWKALKR